MEYHIQIQEQWLRLFSHVQHKPPVFNAVMKKIGLQIFNVQKGERGRPRRTWMEATRKGLNFHNLQVWCRIMLNGITRSISPTLIHYKVEEEEGDPCICCWLFLSNFVVPQPPRLLFTPPFQLVRCCVRLLYLVGTKILYLVASYYHSRHVRYMSSQFK